MNPEQYLTMHIARSYIQVAELTHNASMLDHDRAAQRSLEMAAQELLDTVRRIVKRVDGQHLWVAVDRNARDGMKEFTRGHADDVVRGVRAHVS